MVYHLNKKEKKINNYILHSYKCMESIPSLAVLHIFVTTTKEVKQKWHL